MPNRFRYLEKYVGTYRVLAELDTGTNDFPRDEHGKIAKSFEDLYIPCSKGVIKHTYDPEYELAWFCLGKLGAGRNVERLLQDKYKNIDYKYEEDDVDVIIWFHEEDLETFAKLVKPRTNGSKIAPLSSKNLPKAAYKIPEEDSNKLSEILNTVSKTDRMKLSRVWLKEFDDVIIKKKGKRYNLNDERSNSGMSNKVFIHYLGLWPDYLKFIAKKVKEL